MNKLEKLIAKLCPNGVEYKPLGEVVHTVSASIKLNRKDYHESGLYPIVDQGQAFIVAYTNESDALISDGPYVLFGDHTREVKYVDFPFAQGADGVKILRAGEGLDVRYLYYAVSQLKIKSRGYNRHWPIASKMEIPIPPLPVQEEIVRMLDDMAELISELEQELAVRKQQYEWYLNSYYESSHAPRIALKDIGTLTRGKRFVHADAVEIGVPCIHYGELYTRYGVFATEAISKIRKEIGSKMRYAHKNDVIIVGAGENRDDIGIGLSWEGEYDVAVHDACYTLVHTQNPRYISFFLRSDVYHSQIKRFVSEGKICSISAEGVGRATIPLPSLVEQKIIATAFDSFEKLCRETLPGEIAARKRQYEYYRDRLLSFKRAG